MYLSSSRSPSVYHLVTDTKPTSDSALIYRNDIPFLYSSKVTGPIGIHSGKVNNTIQGKHWLSPYYMNGTLDNSHGNGTKNPAGYVDDDDYAERIKRWFGVFESHDVDSYKREIPDWDVAINNPNLLLILQKNQSLYLHTIIHKTGAAVAQVPGKSLIANH